MTPPSLRAYLAVSSVAGPAARLLLERRLRRGREEAERIAERRGETRVRRPDGFVVWVHAASVGEAGAAHLVIRALAERRRDWRFVFTTGTRTSAEAVARDPPPRATHQYVPLDVLPWVRRFLDHWRPGLALRIDSELWPAALWEMRRRGVPMMLANARISERSARGWRRAPRAAAFLLNAFDRILAQDAASAGRFRGLGAAEERVETTGSLKAAAAPPPADPRTLSELRGAVAGRPLWVAASTHPGEERLALEAHARLRESFPDAMLLIAPRHPERGAEVAAIAAGLGLRTRRRSAGEPMAGAAVYVADTLGEIGLWYRIAPFAFVGGSSGGLGGHNPYEAAALGVAVAHGPDVANFADPYRLLGEVGAAWEVRDSAGLAAVAAEWLAPRGGPSLAGRRAGEAAAKALAPDRAPLDRTVEAVLGMAP